MKPVPVHIGMGYKSSEYNSHCEMFRSKKHLFMP